MKSIDRFSGRTRLEHFRYRFLILPTVAAVALLGLAAQVPETQAHQLNNEFPTIIDTPANTPVHTPTPDNGTIPGGTIPGPTATSNEFPVTTPTVVEIPTERPTIYENIISVQAQAPEGVDLTNTQIEITYMDDGQVTTHTDTLRDGNGGFHAVGRDGKTEIKVIGPNSADFVDYVVAVNGALVVDDLIIETGDPDIDSNLTLETSHQAQAADTHFEYPDGVQPRYNSQAGKDSLTIEELEDTRRVITVTGVDGSGSISLAETAPTVSAAGTTSRLDQVTISPDKDDTDGVVIHVSASGKSAKSIAVPGGTLDKSAGSLSLDAESIDKLIEGQPVDLDVDGDGDPDVSISNGTVSVIDDGQSHEIFLPIVIR